MTQPTLDLPESDVQEGAPQPLVTTQQLLECGMRGGRALIEQPRPARKKRDTLTADMFGQKGLF